MFACSVVVSRTRALCTPGAGLVAPPAERASLIPVRARPGRRRRAARSLWDPRGSGLRGATTSFSPSSGSTAPGDVLFNPVHGHPAVRAPGPRSSSCVPAADPRGPSLTPPRAAANSCGFSRRAKGGRHPPPRPPQPQEIRPSLKRRAAPLRGAIRRPGPPLLRRRLGLPEPRSRTNGSREAPRQPPHHDRGLEGLAEVAGSGRMTEGS
ncbi:hypothetical protein NDU88_003778 [Pleurodeles waltl]|uniref:Uncharacterized protein n=1 Tax=Pleurodeles waltl TaxID=8319 RepID=A0AAV7SGV4_PLEWA|nr:hypothetical protein NDU88_003778 [Pleurodeles waltl]